MDWGKLLRDRRVQIGGVGVAALAGLVVYLRRRGQTSSSSTDAAAAGDGSTGGAPYTPGAFPDTSGTDIATWLGQYSQGLQQQLDEYTQSQTDFLAALGHEGVPAPVPGPGTPPPKPKPGSGGGVPKPKPPTTSPAYVTVTKWTASNPPWSSTLSGIAAHEHTTVSALLKLNPTIKDPDVIRTGAKIRYR